MGSDDVEGDELVKKRSEMGKRQFLPSETTIQSLNSMKKMVL